MGAFQALVTIVGLIGILAFLLVIVCRYLGGWTWTRAWLTSSREEKMVLTRGTGQYHPNGFMIRSDSDLNLSGRGSFRRFDKTDQDYQLLRQGSTVSIPSSSLSGTNPSIPPQPLRPAPSLPPTVSHAVHQSLEQQNSTDSVFTVEPLLPPLPRSGQSMPPPRIPPPPPSSIASTGSNNSGQTPRSLPSFSMTNPFLPLLQASTQFFSQTLQGLQSFQGGSGVPSVGNQREEQQPEGYGAPSQPPAGSYEPGSNTSFKPSIHSSTSSGRSGISMGELLFSATPSVTSEASAVLVQPHSANPPREVFSSSENMANDYSVPSINTGRIDSSNPFSPHALTPHPPLLLPSTSSPKGEESDGQSDRKEFFTWADVKRVEEPSDMGQGTTPLGSTGPEEAKEPRRIERVVEASVESVSIFDQIRDFNELSLSRNMEEEGGSILGRRPPPPSSIQPRNATMGGESSSNLNWNGKSVTRGEGDVSGSSAEPGSELTSNPVDNRDPLKTVNSSVISSNPPTGIGHYSCFPSSYRNARSFSLRQASTDSIGSEASDLGSPEGSLPSLQRAMSCDSVCSDTSVVLGELDQTQLTGHLCVGLEYDSETADLLVNVIEAKEINGLHPDPTTPFDSYVRVYLLPDKTTNMQTRVYRKSLNPIYKEKFMFGLELAELPIRSLMFYMYATDKYSNTLIGEAELKLRDVDVHQLPMTTWLPLTDSGQRCGDFGEIMFSLSYLPTAERLTVVIVKARNLKFPRENVGDPFVKVYLLQRGKKVSKKKSSTKRGEKNPIFNEAMIFGVPAHALQTIQLRITVADCGEADGNRAYSVGHVIVGSMSTGKPLSHWNQMLSSLRKPIAMWHSLRK